MLAISRTAQRCSPCTLSLLHTLHPTHVEHMHASPVHHKVVPKNLQGRSKTAQDWLTRQLNDPYVFRARKLNYRARSAFKLLELHQRFDMLRPGAVVVECGASPGAWSQVAVQHCNPRGSAIYKEKFPTGVVVGVDLQPVSKVPGATHITGDFTLHSTQRKLLEVLHPHKPDVVLSDMAPNATGSKDLDHERIMRLAFAVAHFAKDHAVRGSSLVCKVWTGPLVEKYLQQLTHLYNHVKLTKPPASRTNSAEVFVVARGLIRGTEAYAPPPEALSSPDPRGDATQISTTEDPVQ